jgi:hypothetical protein
MADSSPNPEILPPERQLVQVWRWQVLSKTVKVIKVAAMLPLLGVAGWLVQNFLQLRGVVNLTASRIDLGLLALCIFIGGCVLTIGMQRKWMWRIVIGFAVFLIALGIDRLAPKPQVQATNAPRQHDVQVQLVPELKTEDKVAISASHSDLKPNEHKSTKQSPVPLRVYDLTGRRRDAFKALLNTQLEPRDVIRVGCIGWIEESCVAAGNFLLLISEADWKIDSNRVFRFDPSIPIEGVNIESRSPKYTDNLPPHLGHWVAMDASDVTLWRTFSWMQIPVQGSGNPDMPEGTIGIYFGPEPRNMYVRTVEQAQKELAQVLGLIRIQARAIDNTCHEDDTCKTKRLQWTQTVSAFLDYCDCGLNPSWKKKWGNSAKGDELTLGRQQILERFVVALNKAK